MEPLHIEIDDFVGYGNASFNHVKAQLKGAKGRKVRTVVNGYGGYVTDGVGIYNLLRAHDGETETHIATWAFSADTIIAMGGKHRTMAENGFFMVHNPLGGVYGEAEDMEANAAILRMMEKQLIDIYARETNIGKRKIKEMMDAETWLSAKEALDLGFVHELTPGAMIQNSFDPKIFRNITPPPLPTKQPTTNKISNMKTSLFNAIRTFFNTEHDADEAALEAVIKKFGSLENFTASIRTEVETELTAAHTAELQAVQAAAKQLETELTAAQAEIKSLTDKVAAKDAIITDKDAEITTLKNEGGGEHAGGKTNPPVPPKNGKTNPITAAAKEKIGTAAALPFD